MADPLLRADIVKGLQAADEDGYGSDAELMSKEVVCLPALPRSLERRLTHFAKKKFEQLTVWRDFAGLALCYCVAHQGLEVQSKLPGTAPARCAIHSFTIVTIAFVAILVNVGVVVWREGFGKKLPTVVELAVDVFQISIGILFSASVGTFEYYASSSIVDVCTSINNPIAGLAALLSDINGLLTLLRSALLTFHRPFSCGDKRITGYASTLILVLIATLLQLLLLDRVVIPLVNDAVVKNEANGDPLDWLQDVLFPNGTAV